MDKLISQKLMFCPICKQEHMISIYGKKTDVEIRSCGGGQKGTYTKHYCICNSDRGEVTFIPGWMTKRNIHRAKACVTNYKDGYKIRGEF